jgi:cytosine/adenosine deaminase-related metal-dependent hydrolase
VLRHEISIGPNSAKPQQGGGACASADAGIVLNHLSNMKLKSGIVPVCDLREAGVRLGLGCDNCSGSDVPSLRWQPQAEGVW